MTGPGGWVEPAGHTLWCAVWRIDIATCDCAPDDDTGDTGPTRWSEAPVMATALAWLLAGPS